MEEPTHGMSVSIQERAPRVWVIADLVSYHCLSYQAHFDRNRNGHDEGSTLSSTERDAYQQS